jgi:DNA-binding transcriptional LysR family regulator
MDMRELRYFLAVYETGSVSAAARRAFVSQPSVSVAISALEAELGAELFLRHKKGVVPTASAQQFYPRARRLVDEAQALSKLFKRDAAPVLTIGLMKTLDIARTMALLAPLSGEGGARLTLVEADDPCDARIISRPLLRQDERFVELWREPYVVALPAAHPLRVKARIDPGDLKQLRFIQRCHCENADLFAQLGFRPEVAAIAGSEEWAVALVAAGVGVAVLPSGVVRASEHLAVRPLAGLRVERSVGLAYGAAAAPPAAIGGLLDGLTGKARGRSGITPGQGGPATSADQRKAPRQDAR